MSNPGPRGYALTTAARRHRGDRARLDAVTSEPTIHGGVVRLHLAAFAGDELLIPLGIAEAGALARLLLRHVGALEAEACA